MLQYFFETFGKTRSQEDAKQLRCQKYKLSLNNHTLFSNNLCGLYCPDTAVVIIALTQQCPLLP